MPERATGKIRSVYSLVNNKYWVDEIYGAVVVAPVFFIARYLFNVLIDRGVIDGGRLRCRSHRAGIWRARCAHSVRKYSLLRRMARAFRRPPARRFLFRMDHTLLGALKAV